MSTDAEASAIIAETKEKPIFTGACICKKVTYSVKLNLPDDPSLTRCNCTICQRVGSDSLEIPKEDFHLKTPCSTAECTDEGNKHGSLTGVLTLDTSPTMTRYFCDVCGVHFLVAGEYVYDGKTYPRFAFNVRTLHQPQEGLDLSLFQYMYLDGLDNFKQGHSTDGPYPGGSL